MHTARTFLHLPAGLIVSSAQYYTGRGRHMWKLIVCNTVSIDGYD
jgi:hypothetical protein